MRKAAPSPNGENGRRKNGQFAPGWKGGPGNPYGRRAARLRGELYRAITPGDVKDVLAALLKEAKAGDVPAATLLFQRLWGPPTDPEINDRLARVEAILAELEDGATRRRL